jgi:hypothetical protein
VEREHSEIRVEHPRCPFCHEDVRAEQEKHACVACMAWHHEACWHENRDRCATCGQAPAAKPQERPFDPAAVTVLTTSAAALEQERRLGRMDHLHLRFWIGSVVAFALIPFFLAMGVLAPIWGVEAGGYVGVVAASVGVLLWGAMSLSWLRKGQLLPWRAKVTSKES